MSQSYRTKDAAKRLTEHYGHPASVSSLKHARMRGPEDPRDRGPDFYRDPMGICWYTEESLARYAAEKLSARRLRAPATMPTNFRRAARA